MKAIVLLLETVGIAFVFVWLNASLHQMARCKADMTRAGNQLDLYRAQQAGVKSEMEYRLRQEQVEISEDIYKAAVDAYHRTLQKPMNRIPAFFLGFHLEKKGETTYGTRIFKCPAHVRYGDGMSLSELAN